MKDLVEAKMTRIPKCNFCQKDAEYDGKTHMGRGYWAYMCQEHFEKLGVGLGTGRGQKLIKIGGTN